MQGKDLRRKTRFPGADKLRHPGEGRDEALDRASEVVGLLAPGQLGSVLVSLALGAIVAMELGISFDLQAAGKTVLALVAERPEV